MEQLGDSQIFDSIGHR